jgi:hypothetical protein
MDKNEKGDKILKRLQEVPDLPSNFKEPNKIVYINFNICM